MSNYNSQEQTIYRNLAGKIQLGFYDGGERFPSAKEIASGYQVSYCPAQRALKMLEKDGLISSAAEKRLRFWQNPMRIIWETRYSCSVPQRSLTCAKD